MKTIIIEDEQLAARRLEAMIKAIDPSVEVIARLESVEESVAWFKSNPHPDLIFLDIHLEDGLSFSIFDQVKTEAPIIFTTAFDEYAIRAFKLKSIDYLLKPIIREDLERSILKYREWGTTNQLVDINELYKLMYAGNKSYRQRFSAVVGQKLKSVDINDIAYFFSNSGITFLALHSRNQYALDLSLEKLAEEVDPNLFFRVNRQFLVGLSAITNIHIFPKSRLKLDLNPPVPESVFVSLDKVAGFKKWIDGRKN